jgi:ATP-dependent Lon protease
VLAAFRAGLKRVIIPARNKQDLDEVPEDVRENIDFVFVKTIDQLLNTVFGGRTRKRPAKHKAAKRKVTKGKVAKRNVPKRKAAKPPTKKLKS